MGRSLLIVAKSLKTTPSRFSNILLQQQKRCFDMHSQTGPSKEQFAAVKQEVYGNLCRENVRLLQQFPIPEINNPAVQAKRSLLFSKEKERQFREVGRIHKITVDFKNEEKFPESASLIMNKNISTPYQCAQHLGELITDRSIVAEVNGQLWDMHRPLEDNCTLRLLHMKLKDEDPYHVNRVFWRSCSFMLGAVCEFAFRDHIYMELHSFPSPNVRSGSFVYDVDLKLRNWNPNSDETRVLSAEMIKLSRKKLHFERLEVDVDLALEMFQDNKYKFQQIPEIAQSSVNGRTICIYRVGDFIDISKGPMMTHTGHLNKCTITAVHPLPQCNEISETLYRLQGVALPSGFLLNHYAYGLIEQRGRKLNAARIPGTLPMISTEQLLPEKIIALASG